MVCGICHPVAVCLIGKGLNLLLVHYTAIVSAFYRQPFSADGLKAFVSHTGCCISAALTKGVSNDLYGAAQTIMECCPEGLPSACSIKHDGCLYLVSVFSVMIYHVTCFFTFAIKTL